MSRLPSDSTAEEAIISLCMLDDNAAHTATAALDAADFFVPAHGRIWKALNRALEQELAPTPEIIASLLRDVGAGGDEEALLALTLRLPDSSSLEALCKRVKNKSAMRSTIVALKRLAAEGMGPVEDDGAWLESVDEAITEVTRGKHQDGNAVHLGEAVEAMISDLVSGKELACKPLRSGIDSLDDAVGGGWVPGDLIVVGARSGAGKSALCQSIALGINRTEGVPGLFASYEMGQASMARRALSMMAKVPNTAFSDLGTFSRMTQVDQSRFMQSASDVAQSNLYVMTRGDFEAIASQARRIKRTHGGRLGPVVVDYLQIMPRADIKGMNEATQLARVTQRFKVLAEELEAPLFLVSQLSRKVDQRADQRPQMGDLRDSSGIESAANVILLVHRPFIFTNRSEDANKAEVIVAKNRNGATGSVDMRFIGPLFTFADQSNDGPPKWGTI